MIRATATGCTLSVRIQPGAKRTAILGTYGECDQLALKIAVQAPPIEGRANDGLIAFLAKILELPRSAVIVVQGEQSRSKVIQLDGIHLQRAAMLLKDHLPSNV